jgi:hypothetical protein
MRERILEHEMLPRYPHKNGDYRSDRILQILTLDDS